MQFRPTPPRRTDDYRHWEYAATLPPSNSEQFVVVSYNILADYLARDHQMKLYDHIPPHMLDWEWRKSRILMELGLWGPELLISCVLSFFFFFIPSGPCLVCILELLDFL